MYKPSELIELVKAGIITKEEANQVVKDSHNYISIKDLKFEIERIGQKLEEALNRE